MSNKVEIKVLNPLRGKYKLPYSTGHVVSLPKNMADELIKNKDAELHVQSARKPKATKPETNTSKIEVKDPVQETGKEE
jgi:hypothetical protein